MTRGISYTRRWAWLFAVSAAAAAGAVLAKSALKARYSRDLLADAVAEQAAAARVAAMSGSDDAHLLALRERARRFRTGLGGAATKGAVLKCLGDRWVREAESTSEHEGYSATTGRFRMNTPSSSDWPAIVESVDRLEKLPGVAIQNLELKSGQSGAERSLDEVTLVLEVAAAKPGSDVFPR